MNYKQFAFDLIIKYKDTNIKLNINNILNEFNDLSLIDKLWFIKMDDIFTGNKTDFYYYDFIPYPFQDYETINYIDNEDINKYIIKRLIYNIDSFKNNGNPRNI